MKKITALVLAALMLFALAACGNSSTPAGSADAVDAVTPAEGEVFTVGVCQLVQHPALDAATQGFVDVLEETFGEGNVVVDVQNASGDSANCATICSGFVSEGVDLILANATPALQAAAAATNTIPVLGTSITEYGVALEIADFDGTVGTNVSGTSDLAPLDQQAAMVTELFPDAENVGILYCSGEPNSVYQADVVKAELEKAGVTVTDYTFSDSNDVAAVTGTACDECDALYIPTDNTAASCTEAINNVAQPAGVPIIAGEEGLCKGCGIATLSISYYELGRATGEQAVQILNGETDVSEMEIGYDEHPVKKYNATLCAALGIEIPEEGYDPIAD